MSLPPETIQVKRKRSREGDDSSTVDFLRVERDTKRHRSLHGDERWVYQRKQPDLQRSQRTALPQSRDILPVIQVSQPGDEIRLVKSTRQPSTGVASPAIPLVNGSPSNEAVLASTTHPTALAPRLGDHSRDNVRRFHMSRTPSPSLFRKVHHGGISRKRSAPALFVERSRKLISDSSPLSGNNQTANPARHVSAVSQKSEALEQVESDMDIEITERAGSVENQTPARPNKKPGAAARATKKSGLPPSLLNRDGANMDQLAKDMHDYTIQQISKTLQEEKGREEKEAKAKFNASQRSKYRPKAPAKRFADRHPEYVAQWEREHREKKTGQTEDTEMNEDASDDDDYVLETYVRVPASRLPSDVEPHRVGLLVFDNEPDVDFFYGEDEEDEEEDPDEDDENAENYYGADYPEDEMEWSDEMGVGSTRYRSRNAAEDEYFDERDWDSDEENLINRLWNRDAKRTAEDKILQSIGEYADEHGH